MTEITTWDWLQLAEIAMGIVVAVVFLVSYVSSVGWATRDAQSRGKPGCLVAALVALTWPLSLLMWIVFRPGDQNNPHKPEPPQ